MPIKCCKKPMIAMKHLPTKDEFGIKHEIASNKNMPYRVFCSVCKKWWDTTEGTIK